MISYRLGTLADIDLITDFRMKFLQEALEISKNDFDIEVRKSIQNYLERKMPINGFVAWLAFHENECIATSGLSFYEVPPAHTNISGKVAYIMNMYTKPEWRKKGIGTNLLKRLIEEIRSRNIQVVSLHATEIGKSLYEKFDFIDSNEMKLKLKK